MKGKQGLYHLEARCGPRLYSEWSPDSVVGVVQDLQCKSSEDGDGATVLGFLFKGSGRMPGPLQFAVDSRSGEGS